MAKKKSRTNNSKNKKITKWHAVPLKGSFMATAMLGFFISAYYVYPRSPDFGIAFMIVFTAMFFAALISMTKAPILNERY